MEAVAGWAFTVVVILAIAGAGAWCWIEAMKRWRG